LYIQTDNQFALQAVGKKEKELFVLVDEAGVLYGEDCAILFCFTIEWK
jgi:hypothetical protein